jgi:protein SCO1/2
MKAIEAALPEGGRSKVGFTLVSFDSERDTPPVLKGFRARHELRADDWTLLHGEPDDARELAALLGVNYRKEANGEYAHSNLITLLNAEGEIVYQLNGLGHRPDEIIKQVKSLLNGLGRSSLKSSD